MASRDTLLKKSLSVNNYVIDNISFFEDELNGYYCIKGISAPLKSCSICWKECPVYDRCIAYQVVSIGFRWHHS